MISAMYIKMPYKLRKARNKDLYWVVDGTGDKYSNKPIPLDRAEKQITALHINTGHGLRGGSLNANVAKAIELFDRGFHEDIVRMSLQLYMDNATAQQIDAVITQAKQIIAQRLQGGGDEGYDDELAMYSEPSIYERRELEEQIRRAEEKQRQAVQAMIEAERQRKSTKRPVKRRSEKFKPTLEPIEEIDGMGMRGGAIFKDVLNAKIKEILSSPRVKLIFPRHRLLKLQDDIDQVRFNAEIKLNEIGSSGVSNSAMPLYVLTNKYNPSVDTNASKKQKIVRDALNEVTLLVDAALRHPTEPSGIPQFPPGDRIPYVAPDIHIAPQEDEIDREKVSFPPLRVKMTGGKLAHIKKYLKGLGIRATKKNIDHAMSACDAEGVVFSE